MTDSAAEFWSAVGTCASAIIAFFGLFGIAWQISLGRRGADLQALQTFLRDAKEHENALIQAKGSAKDQAFVEYLNFLETYSAAVNDRLFPPVTRKHAIDRIIGAVVMIGEMPEWHDKIDKAITSSTTFDELRDFIKKHRRIIEAKKNCKR